MPDRPTATRVVTIIGAALVAASFVGVVYGGITALIAGRGVEGAYMLGFAGAVALLFTVRRPSATRRTEPDPVPLVVPGQDAFDLADRLSRGQGMEAIDVIYGGSYDTPARMAQLMEQTAAVLRISK